MRRYYDLFAGLFFLGLLTLGFLLIVSNARNNESDRVIHDKRLDNIEIRKIFKDNYKSFENISEYLLNNEQNCTIASNSEGKLIILDKSGQNKIIEDKIEAEAEILINKLGFLSITENSNEIDFTRLVEGVQGKIFKYKPGGHATSEFLEEIQLAEGWNLKFH